MNACSRSRDDAPAGAAARSKAYHSSCVWGTGSRAGVAPLVERASASRGRIQSRVPRNKHEIGRTMSKEHITNLRTLRDSLVEERRSLATSMLADPHSTGESAMDFINLQQFIDTLERAIGHEQSLDRPAGSWPPKQKPPNMP